MRRLFGAAFFIALVAVLAPATAGAQDTTVRRPPTVPPKSHALDSLKPPISPRRAFAYSFFAPGYGQSVLGRHRAAVAFMLVESISLVMIRESGADVHEARRMANDTVVVSYVDAFGNPAATTSAPRFSDKEIRTREAHVEDWAALLVANHLFAGADAFVAAHLWDIPVRLALRAAPHGAALTAAVKW